MRSSPRRLTFAVGTSLLTASLAAGVAGCAGQKTVNPMPPEPEPTVNEGPVDEASDEPAEETVNEGPVPDDGVDEPDPHVNVVESEPE